MHVLVLGVGVIGVTTAYYLSRIGCDVTIVERNSRAAGETTHTNGGQLSYSFTDSLESPDSLLRQLGVRMQNVSFADYNARGHQRWACVRPMTPALDAP